MNSERSETPAAAPPPERHWPALILVLLAFLPGAIASPPTLSADTWWHLRIGEWIRTHEQLPTHDPLARTDVSGAREWLAYSWLYELLLDASVQAAGLPGVLLVRHGLCALAVLSVVLFLTQRGGAWPWVSVVVGMVLVVWLPYMSERPWHATLVGMVLTLHAIERAQAGRYVWWLPLAYVLWANVHIQFVLGLGVLGLAGVSALVERFRHHSRCPLAWRNTEPVAPLGPIVFLGLTCGLAGLVTPLGGRIVTTVVEYATQTGSLQYITEAQPLVFVAPWERLTFVLLALALVALGRQTQLRTFDVLLLLASAYFALRMKRDIWFAALAAGYVLLPRGGPAPVFRRWETLALTVGGYGLAVVLSSTLTIEPFAVAQAKMYPVRAVEFARAQGYVGPVFNGFDWGGYIGYAWPDQPVTIDGRTNLFGEAMIQRNFATYAGGPDWATDPDLASARLVFAAPGQALTQLLRLSPEWVQVYPPRGESDELAVVFIRRE
jgi:hypothetical protein